MWCVLFPLYFVLKQLQCFFYVVGHGQVDSFLFVIPVKSYADVSFSRPIRGDCVVVFKCCFEMVYIFLFVYFTPKLSTTNVNCMGFVLCFHKPGTNLLCQQPCLFSRFSSCLLERRPAWGSPYMPLVASMYTLPSGVARSRILYYMMISSGISLSLILLYYECLSGVIK